MLLHDGLELGSQGLNLNKSERSGLTQPGLRDLLLIFSSDHRPTNKCAGLLFGHEVFPPDFKGKLGVQL